MSGISVAERERFRLIFQSLKPVDGVVNGQRAKDVLMQSGLKTTQLHQIWELVDTNADGCLDCEEFILMMHIIFNTINGHEIPRNLPEKTKEKTKQKYDPYIAPAEKLKYELEFVRNLNSNDAKKTFLLYKLPESEFNHVWDLVRQNDSDLNLEQYIMFHHVCKQRMAGKEYPVELKFQSRETNEQKELVDWFERYLSAPTKLNNIINEIKLQL